MKYYLLILGLMISVSSSLKSQDSTYIAQKPVDIIHFEILGPGGLYSLNYERITPQKLIFRGGLSYVNTTGFFEYKGFTLPFSVSILFKIRDDSHFEVGAFSTVSTIDKFDVWVGTTVGLRNQKLKAGTGAVKLFFSPFYSIRYNQFVPSVGLSLGSSF